jgi:hypothetical protein
MDAQSRLLRDGLCFNKLGAGAQNRDQNARETKQMNEYWKNETPQIADTQVMNLETR